VTLVSLCTTLHTEEATAFLLVLQLSKHQQLCILWHREEIQLVAWYLV